MKLVEQQNKLNVDSLVRSNETLRKKIEQLNQDRNDLLWQLHEFEQEMHANRTSRRAALNLMEDAVVARRAEQHENAERQRIEQELRQSNRRKDEFLATLAHELRNPLAPIRSGLHILRLSNPSDSSSMRIVEMMERQISHMVRLVDDLMEVSRITRGNIQLRTELVEVDTIIRNAIEMSRPMIEAAGHHLTLAMPSKSLLLKGDSVRLTQVIANLLNNAAKYTNHNGQISLTVEQDDHEVIISVRDTGTGIPADMIPHVFELFTQVNKGDGRVMSGLGIGLTLVRSIVDLHGGSVQVHSEGEGQGSEFVIRLPVADTPHSTDVMGSQIGLPPVLAPRDILIVDDNYDAADSLGIVLKELGANVQVVYSGPEALQALLTYQPSVILLDIGMQGMDGNEVARRIRQQAALQNVPLIALTGLGQEADRRQTQAAGFDYHLTKPADVNALVSLLSSLEPRTSC